MADVRTHVLAWLQANKYFPDHVKIDYIRRAMYYEEDKTLMHKDSYSIEYAINESPEGETLVFHLCELDSNWQETGDVVNWYEYEDIDNCISALNFHIRTDKGEN